MKKWIIIWILCGFCTRVASQDSILHRIILIGDAGEMDQAQQTVIYHASLQSLPGKTTAIFLGDNIYKRGIGLPGSKEQLATEAILRSQFDPLRKAQARVYFIPGNHDWDRMGKNGLAKIKRQWQFLEEQNDSLLQMIPRDGCPDPVAIPLGDSLVIIAMDSEWWLFPFPKSNPKAECDCNSREEIIASLEQLYFVHRHKMILLATHHPFQSYGTHGGKFQLKDHLFPLTKVNKHLKIPLPVLGSLYPLLRKTFSNPEDLGHPLYKDLIKKVDDVFKGTPNLLHISGHEHGLQMIINLESGFKQIVSGAGAKINHTIKGKNSLYGKAATGYVIADWLTGGHLRIQFYEQENNELKPSFAHTLKIANVPADTLNALTSYDGDSATVFVRKEYNEVSNWKRKMLGENYRAEFATSVKLPVMRLSVMQGGLEPLKRGGGMQTVSLRLKDRKGNEWVLRNLEKNPDPLLPEALRETFARDLLDDYMSAQHPFAPLLVPVLAKAAQVPHANPIIGIVAPDSVLGIHQRLFAGKLALLEEREPLGKSDNTIEMQEEMLDDNDNGYNATTFLRARLLDLLISDWDRHADQWRWADTRKGKEKYYEPVPRDRDQALYLREGLLPKLASRSWILPTLQGFNSRISKVKFSLFKSAFVNAYMQDQWSKEKWDQVTGEFISAISDAVIDSAFGKIPPEIYQLRGKRMAATMKARRDQIPQAMESYYRFINRIVDIRGTRKNEWVHVTGNNNGDLDVLIRKINKEGVVKDTLMHKIYTASLTKEVRIYLEAGNDSLFLNNNTSRIKLRIIGGEGTKNYTLQSARRKIKIYDLKSAAQFNGQLHRANVRLSDDTAHTRFVPVNLYHVTMPLLTVGYNLDDGIIAGLGFKHTHHGFRKLPFASEHQLMAAHSFSTRAYRIRYKGIWTQVWGKVDLQANLIAKAPDNTQNYFGRGNRSSFEKIENFIRYYRARFAIYVADIGLRWKGAKGFVLTTGPSLQWYRFDADDNDGRFISEPSRIGTYDSNTIDRAKWHLGWTMHLINDTRNHPLLPGWGSLVDIKLQAYEGLNSFAKTYGQGNIAISIYKSLNAKRTILLAERIGAGFTLGKTTYYQSQFLGGHENLLGFRQYRFAGQHMLFNNLELRIKLADWGGYILPGQFGLTGFYDIGRVWETGESSHRWHQGMGGGFYYALARMVLLQLVAGYSKEGWLPYFTVGFRF